MATRAGAFATEISPTANAAVSKAEAAPDLSGDDVHWVRAADTDCWAYNDSSASSFRWNGACKDRLIHGSGTLIWFAGGVQTAVLTGTFARGKLNGPGRADYENASKLEGTFKDGKLEGSGKEIWPCGSSYEGTFHNGEPDGEGTIHFCDTGIYSGGFHAGQLEGHGVWTMRNGAVVDGSFSKNLPMGIAKYRGADGMALKGEIKVPQPDRAFPILPTAFPDGARALEEQGRVWIEFTVTTDGRAKDIKLERTSGYPDLDEAALAAAPSWRLTPAMVGGTAVEWPVRRAVSFQIETRF
jgi:TonB family protein